MRAKSRHHVAWESRPAPTSMPATSARRLSAKRLNSVDEISVAPIRPSAFIQMHHADGDSNDDDCDQQSAIYVLRSGIRGVHHSVRRRSDRQKGAEKSGQDTYCRHCTEDNEFGIANVFLFRGEDDNQRECGENL